jgi:hypothetical protein
MKIGLLELLMGIETPIPPKMITPAAPAPASIPFFPETELAPPCPVRGPEAGSPPINSGYITDFCGLGVNRIGSYLVLQNTFLNLTQSPPLRLPLLQLRVGFAIAPSSVFRSNYEMYPYDPLHPINPSLIIIFAVKIGKNH